MVTYVATTPADTCAAPAPGDENVAPATTVADAASVTTVTTRATVFYPANSHGSDSACNSVAHDLRCVDTHKSRSINEVVEKVLGDGFQKTVLCDRIVDAPHTLTSFALFEDIAVCRVARLLTGAY